MATGIKTGGRSAGTPNKITKDIREKISDFVNEQWEQVQQDWLLLEPEKRILLFDKFLQYTLPKMKQVDFIENDKNTIVPKRIEFINFTDEEEHNISLTKEQIDRAIEKI